MAPTYKLDEALDASRLRTLHIIAILGLVMVAISVKIALADFTQLYMLPAGVFWFFGCIVFAVFSIVWLKKRATASSQFREVILQKTPIYKIERVDVSLYWIPIGIELCLDVADTDKSPLRITLGFWTVHAAERLLAMVSDNPVTKPPKVTFRVELPKRASKHIPRAKVVSKREQP